jgi:hypothetical protein
VGVCGSWVAVRVSVPGLFSACLLVINGLFERKGYITEGGLQAACAIHVSEKMFCCC